MNKIFKIEYYVPESHAEITQKALFSAGAGRIGSYDQCCWKTLGQGEFSPLHDSNPYLGQINQTKKVKEYKIELVCAEEFLKESIESMIQSHPYETPAYNYWPINFTD